MSDPTVKAETSQISNYVGAAVGIIGNALPYITPDFLTSIGLSPTAVHTISSVAAVLLIAYREKKPALAVTVAVAPPVETVAPTSGDTNAKS
jgi:hypothetical protein